MLLQSKQICNCGLFVCICTRYICMYMFMYVNMYACVYVHMHVCIQINATGNNALSTTAPHIHLFVQGHCH